MMRSDPSRAQELLVDRATEGLDRERQQEVSALLETSDRAAGWAYGSQASRVRRCGARSC